MLWDRTRIIPVKAPLDRRNILLLWVSERALPSAIANACDMAAIDVLAAKHLDRCLWHIAKHKPDILLQDVSLTATWPAFINKALDTRVTLTLPILDFVVDPITYLALGPESGTIEALLAIKGLLRRERPGLINKVHDAGNFILDESSFKLSCGENWVGINKTDLCTLGPLFDAPDTVFDRQSLARLVCGTAYNYNVMRTIDAQVSRTRRHVTAHLGIDPIRAVRGVGYTLMGCPLTPA